jgi:hypothetical protein
MHEANYAMLHAHTCIYTYTYGPAEVRLLKAVAQIEVHAAPVLCMAFNDAASAVISVCASGMMEYWHWQTGQFPRETVNFRYKGETDLYALAKNKTRSNNAHLRSNTQTRIQTQVLACNSARILLLLVQSPILTEEN